MSDLKPIGPEWIAESITGLYDFALCRQDGKTFLCCMDDESKGWQPIHEATDVEIGGFVVCQHARVAPAAHLKADSLPSHCGGCGTLLMGGATKHAPGCPILELIDKTNKLLA